MAANYAIADEQPLRGCNGKSLATIREVSFQQDYYHGPRLTLLGFRDLFDLAKEHYIWLD